MQYALRKSQRPHSRLCGVTYTLCAFLSKFTIGSMRMWMWILHASTGHRKPLRNYPAKISRPILSRFIGDSRRFTRRASNLIEGGAVSALAPQPGLDRSMYAMKQCTYYVQQTIVHKRKFYTWFMCSYFKREATSTNDCVRPYVCSNGRYRQARGPSAAASLTPI